MKRILLIAPYNSMNILLKEYKAKNPFINVKFISREELVENYYYSISVDAIKYVIKRYDFDYSRANQVLNNILFLKDYVKTNDSQIDFLYKLKDELIKKDLIFENKLFKYELDNSDIHVYYYSKEDPYIKRCLKNVNYVHHDIDGNHINKYIEFEDNDKQLLYVFNKIEELLNNGVSPNKILLYGLNKDDELIFRRLKRNFNLNSNGDYKISYFDLPYVRKLVDNYSGNFDVFISSIDEKDDFSSEVIDLLKTYYIDGLDSFKQKELFKDILKTKKISKKLYKDAIRVVNDPLVDEDEYLFIINYAQGIYPKNYRDDDFLEDKQKVLVNIPTSEEKNVDSLSYYQNLLKQKGHIILSYAKKNQSSKFFVSFISSTLEQTKIYDPTIKDYYSYSEAEYQYSLLCDLHRKYLLNNTDFRAFKKTISIPYRTYNPQYNFTNRDLISKINFSYSSFNTFLSCGFKYYLGNILRIDEFESTFNMVVGNICHNVLERIDEEYSFDELFNQELENQKGNIFDEEMIFIKRLKDEFEKTFNFIKECEQYVCHPQIYRELKLDVKLSENLSLNGRIDKLVLSGENDEYATIMDYKSGSETFNREKFDYGFSMQLPLYILLLKNSDQFKDKKILNILIQSLYFKSSEMSIFDEKRNARSNFLPSGLSSNNLLAQQTYTDLNIDDKKTIKIKLKKDGSLTKKCGVFINEAEFDVIKTFAEQMLVETVYNHLFKNEFLINPKVIKKVNMGCSFCKFKDICFKRFDMNVILDNDDSDESEGDD